EHDTTGDSIRIVAPGGKGKGGVITEIGDRITLTWVLPNGIAKLHTTFLSRDDDPSAAPTSWRLEPISDVQVVERRRSYRARSRQHVALRLDSGALPAVLVDVSEGGMRCLVDTVAPGKLTRDHVESNLKIQGKQVNVRGLVAWSKHHGGHVEVGITFGKIRRQDSDVIRDHVRNSLATSA
ncbi:MAG TPA: PilZ domain-containing protein, partial [Acidimicrobiales bacterium]|nr:PilZ domain-containing protein [Acidimicrobiales bacterium]